MDTLFAFTYPTVNELVCALSVAIDHGHTVVARSTPRQGNHHVVSHGNHPYVGQARGGCVDFLASTDELIDLATNVIR